MGSPRARGPGIQPSRSEFSASIRAAWLGGIPSPPTTISSYSERNAVRRACSCSAIVAFSWRRCSPSLSANGPNDSGLLVSFETMPFTECTNSALLSRSLSRTLTHNGWRAGVTFSRSTRSALVVWAVMSTRLPCARRWPIRLAIVCVFPVPGGPCTRTVPLCSRRSAICSCAAFDGKVKKRSAAAGSAVLAVPSPSSARSTSWATMRESARGRSPPSASHSRNDSHAASSPLTGGTAKITGRR